MARPTYTANVIVLRKTKLKETDLILTCLTEDGSQLRFVAKGARKPNNSFASRLELFSNTHVLAVRGRSLDIVKEAKLICGNKGLRESMERMAAASVVCELLAKSTQPHLEVKRLYPMVARALECMSKCSTAQVGADAVAVPDQTNKCSALQSETQTGTPATASHEHANKCSTRQANAGAVMVSERTNKCSSLQVMAIVEAALLKTFSYLGFQPELRRCIVCGGSLVEAGVAFSYSDGGAVCPRCAPRVNCVRMSPEVLRRAQFLLYSTFADVLEDEGENSECVCGGDSAGNECASERGGFYGGFYNANANRASSDCGSAEHLFVSRELLQFCKTWARAQLGVKLKSMEFLLSLN